MKSVRCSQCKSTQFKEKDIITREGDKVINAIALICLECGHIEWFVDEKELEKLQNNDEKEPWGW